MALTNTQVVALQLEKTRKAVPIAYERGKATFYSTVEKRPAEVISTRDMRVPIKLRPGGRFGHWDPAGGDLGRGEYGTWDKAVINTVHFKYAVEWQTLAEWGVDTPEKAVKNALADKLAEAMVEFRRGSDALCHTDGTGVVGVISAVSNSGGKDTYTFGTDGYGAKLLRFGHMYSIYNTGLTTRRTFTGGASSGGEAPIDLYDGPNKQVRMNGEATGATATDKLVVSGLSTTPPVSLYGIPYHNSNAATGSWLGFDRATTPEVRSNRVAAGATLALSHARLAVNALGDRTGDDYQASLMAWMHPAQVHSYESIIQASMIVQAQAGPANVNPYTTNLQLAGIPICNNGKGSFMWDKTRIDLIDSTVLGRAELHAPDYYEVGGTRIFPIYGTSGGIAGSQVFYLVASWNMFADNPMKLAYIDTLTVPSGY